MFHAIIYNSLLLVSFLYLVFSAIWALAGGAYYKFVLIIAIVPLIFLITRIFQSRDFIDVKLTAGIDKPNDWTVFNKEYPTYKYVDIYRSIEKYMEKKKHTAIASQHIAPLSSILTGDLLDDGQRKINVSSQKGFPVSYKKSDFFPEDIFWIRYNDGASKVAFLIIRFKYNDYFQKGELSIAASDGVICTSCIEEIENYAKINSIYHRQLLEIEFQEEVKDEFGDINSAEKVDLVFLKKENIHDDNIILEDSTKDLLNNSIIQFNSQSDNLRKYNIPLKRGILFFGPPGTGKTYTSKYIANKLTNRTTLVVKGSSLLKIKAICNIAKSLQPSLVILEDVDLIFSHRDINPVNFILSEFLDQLDGFSNTDEIIFIMTTNSIERVETAIKDRPGRVSQCIYMGTPNSELRALYINSLLTQYKVSCPVTDEIIARTNGASQAFLKELIIRGIQTALEAEGKLVKTIDQKYFLKALDIITNNNDKKSKQILGF